MLFSSAGIARSSSIQYKEASSCFLPLRVGHEPLDDRSKSVLLHPVVLSCDSSAFITVRKVEVVRKQDREAFSCKKPTPSPGDCITEIQGLQAYISQKCDALFQCVIQVLDVPVSSVWEYPVMCTLYRGPAFINIKYYCTTRKYCKLFFLHMWFRPFSQTSHSPEPHWCTLTS